MKRQCFLGLLAAAAFFAACSADNSGAEEEAILDSRPGPRYGISVVPEKEGDGGMIAIANADGVVTVSPAGKVKAGATVTLSVNPQLIASADAAGEGGVNASVAADEPKYWFVKSISGAYSMEGGPERTNVSFRPSEDASNKWTFRMTPGDLTITVDFTQDYPDEKNAALGSLSVSNGTIIPDFAKNKYDYTIAVPFGATEFSISAQAENPYLGPVMQASGGGGDNLLDVDLMASGNGGPLGEGLHRYGISVTSGDGATTLTYNINVVQLPDLSLQTFKVTRGTAGSDDYFERDLAPSDTQNVYVPYTAITVVAEATDKGAAVAINPSAAISGILIDSAKTTTVTVSKTLPNVDASLTAKKYTLNLYYGEGMAVSPAADGGYVSFIPGKSGFYYEVHTFTKSGSLSFKDGSVSIVADVLVVAGGGGAGGLGFINNTDFAGGGGGGGLRYQSDASIGLSGGAVAVVVGTGGSGKGSGTQGNNGGDSYIGAGNGPLTAKGGGGGGGGWSNLAGKDGGSAGGGGGGKGNTAGTGGKAIQPKAVGGGLGLGNPGGAGGSKNSTDAGGGGGGAGNAGKAPTGNNHQTPGVGGAGWNPATGGGNYDTAWIADVTGVKEFARGGRGGGPGCSAGNGVNYGDGGSGNGNTTAAGGNGHAGIVIIRFQRKLESKE